MKRVNLGFSRYADAPMLLISQVILAALTGNSFFPTPTPSLALVQTAIDAYAAALALAVEGGKANVAVKKARRKELMAILVQLGNYVILTANSNEEALASSGYPLPKPRTPLPPISKPQIIKLEDGMNSGEQQITIGAVNGARTFVYQYTPDPMPASPVWTGQNSTLTKVLFSGLEPGKKYWFRPIAYGRDEQEVFGDAVLSQIIR